MLSNRLNGFYSLYFKLSQLAVARVRGGTTAKPRCPIASDT